MSKSTANALALAIGQTRLPGEDKDTVARILVRTSATARRRCAQKRFDFIKKLSILRTEIAKLLQVTSPQASVYLCVSPRLFHSKTSAIKKDKTVYLGMLDDFDFFLRVPLEGWWKKHLPRTYERRFKPVANSAKLNQKVHPSIPRVAFLRDLESKEHIWIVDGTKRVLGHATLNDLPDDIIREAAKARGMMFVGSILDVLQMPWADAGAKKEWFELCSFVIRRTYGDLEQHMHKDAMPSNGEAGDFKRM